MIDNNEYEFAFFHRAKSDNAKPHVLGIFFDGTNNNREELPPTNVEFIRKAYVNASIYVVGVGTIGNKYEVALGATSGYGIKDRLDEVIEMVDQFIIDTGGPITIDLFGFSRGAATARAYANKIPENHYNVTLNFIGLFDTVAQVGTPSSESVEYLSKTVQKLLSDWIERNNKDVNQYRYEIPSSAKFTAHAVAGNENRITFPLTSIFDTPIYEKNKIIELEDYNDIQSDKAYEKIFWGAHSDIGGGYVDGSNPSAFYWMLEQMENAEVPFEITFLSDSQLHQIDTCAIHNSQYMYADLLTSKSKNKSLDRAVNFKRSDRLVLNGNLKGGTKSKPQYDLLKAHDFKIYNGNRVNTYICEDKLFRPAKESKKFKPKYAPLEIVKQLEERILSIFRRIEHLEKFSRDWELTRTHIYQELKHTNDEIKRNRVRIGLLEDDGFKQSALTRLSYLEDNVSGLMYTQNEILNAINNDCPVLKSITSSGSKLPEAFFFDN